MQRPFVIHLHSGHGPSHYDLMLSCGPALATWQLSASPADLVPGQDAPANRLPDHRALYLTYQGPVSGGRGRVEMIDSGSYETIERTSEKWRIVLHGRCIRGGFELARRGPAESTWVIRRVADD